MPLPDPIFINQLAFTDGALFAAPWIVPGLSSQRYLGVSKDSKPFAWIGQSGFFAPIPSAAQLNFLAILGDGASLFVSYQYTPCSSSCEGIAVTQDAGGTWSQLTARYQDAHVSLLSVRSDGKDVLGNIYMANGVYRLVHSTDGGQSWNGLPLYPYNPSGTASFELPDGIVFSFLFGDVERVYRLAAQGTSWEEAGPLPVGLPITVSMAVSGVSARLWGQAHAIGSGKLQPGIVYFDVR